MVPGARSSSPRERRGSSKFFRSARGSGESTGPAGRIATERGGSLRPRAGRRGRGVRGESRPVPSSSISSKATGPEGRQARRRRRTNLSGCCDGARHGGGRRARREERVHRADTRVLADGHGARRPLTRKTPYRPGVRVARFRPAMPDRCSRGLAHALLTRQTPSRSWIRPRDRWAPGALRAPLRIEPRWSAQPHRCPRRSLLSRGR